MARGFHPDGKLGQEFLQNNGFVNADDRLIRSGHSGIGLIRGSIGQDPGVRCWYMRVGADHGGHAAVEMPAHGHFFAGQLGVKVDESNLDVRRQCLNQLIGFAKRAIRLGHIRPALQIDDGAIHAIPSPDDHHAAARQLVDVIGRPQQARLAGEIVIDFTLVPDVIAAGQDVDPVAEQLVGELRCNPESAG